MMKLCKEREVTEGKTGWNRVDESRMKAESVTSCCRTCSFYCFEPKRDLINMYDFILHMCVFALVKSAMFTLLLTKTSHYQMWRVVRIGRRGAGRASTYYRPWDQSHQCALKKKKSAPLHSREEQYAVMMLTQVWSMCTFPPQSACPEREVCVCGCFILRRSVHNKQSDRGLQRELKYTKALRKCLNNVA